MMRKHRTTFLAVVGLVLCARALVANPDGVKDDRGRLQVLFKGVQDVLLTVNAEIIRYDERFAVLARKLQDPHIWARRTLDDSELLPTLRELNQMKGTIAQIGTGLDARYSSIKGFQPSLREHYPSQGMDIDYFYNLFDKLYSDTRQRQRILDRKMGALRSWFKHSMEQHAGLPAKEAPPQRYSWRRFHKPLGGPAPGLRGHLPGEPRTSEDTMASPGRTVVTDDDE